MTENNKRYITFLFARIVWYKVSGHPNGKSVPDPVSLMKKLLDPHAEAFHGQMMKAIGEGILVQFNSPRDAVDCALRIQTTAREQVNAKIRIGIHLGEVNDGKEEALDDGSNIALRLQSIADPGGIYVSDLVKMAIQDHAYIQVKFLGEIRLKNVLYGVNTYAIQGENLPVPEIKNSTSFSGRFWAELHRRNVLRAGATYLLISLVILMLMQYVIQRFDLPGRIHLIMAIVLSAGFVLALVLAWNFELSPQGFIRTSSKESWRNPYQPFQRKPFTNEFILIGISLIIAIIYFLMN